MTQATTVLPAAGRRPAPATGQSTAGPRFLKLLVAVLLVPIAGLMAVALVDLSFGALVWHHAGSASPTLWRRLSESLPGVLGLTALGASLGVWWQACTAPERWLQRYATRLLGGQEAPGRDGSFLVRWAVFELPLWALAMLGLQAGLRQLGYELAADLGYCAIPLCYGLYLAQLARRLSWKEEICTGDGTLFAWISSGIAQLIWVVAGLLFFLQAKPIWQFSQEWFQAAGLRAAQAIHFFDR